MKNRFKCVVVIIVVLNFPFVKLWAQENSVKPEIGKPVPEFILSDIGNFKKLKMSSNDFKGRFLIIDFWNKGCVSCVQSFPKLNKLHESYKDKLDIVLVGTEEDGIRTMFENFKVKQSLKFAYAFNFPMYNSFVPNGAPHLIWIDDNGIVKAITPGTDLTSENIDAFLQRKTFSFTDHSHSYYAKEALKKYDLKIPFLVNGNGGGDKYDSVFRYRSLITEYIPGTPEHFFYNSPLSAPGALGTSDGKRQVYEVVASLKELYRVAFTSWLQWGYGNSIYNEVHPKIEFHLRDTSLFTASAKNMSGHYWYSLVMPVERVTPAYVMNSMQNDLERYFGYNARLETRKLPYLKIVASAKAKQLVTKGGTLDTKVDHSSFRATNLPVEKFFESTLSYVNYWEKNGKVPVIINESGFKDNIDVDIKISSTDWADIQRVYKELGFEFVPGVREFKVLVISDKP